MPESSVSRSVLEETPGRALKFLSGVGKSRVVFGLLAQRGYSQEVHDRGWMLLHKASGYHPGDRPPAVNKPAQDAMQQLDAWDEPNFSIIAASLQQAFPEQGAFLFAGDLEPADGNAAIVTCQTMMDRLDALESGAGRTTTRDHDQAALQKLATRGITPEERQHVKALLKAATAVSAPETSPAEVEAAQLQYAADLEALRAWYAEWSRIAHAVIRKRTHLISLGLAKRRSRAEESVADPVPELAPPG
ncbi:MAG: hypothetical protein HY904_07735 [Deltaproteobacteria bacterium]|nr:hypothetical protein [Deltaproteobacteria bacterium]